MIADVPGQPARVDVGQREGGEPELGRALEQDRGRVDAREQGVPAVAAEGDVHGRRIGTPPIGETLTKGESCVQLRSGPRARASRLDGSGPGPQNGRPSKSLPRAFMGKGDKNAVLCGLDAVYKK